MLLERIWPRLWLPMAIAALFILVSTFGLWPTLPVTTHIIMLALFALALLTSFLPVLKIKRPDRHAAIRWLEKKSGLPHRPATVIDDHLCDNSMEPSNIVWQTHKQRASKHIKAMKTGLPHPRTARFDPYALRVPLVLALATTIGLHSERISPGLHEAFEFLTATSTTSLRIDAWVTPPAYTGAPPVMLVNGAKSPDDRKNINNTGIKLVKIPEMSELVVRVSGPNADKTSLALHQPPALNNRAKHSAFAATMTAKVEIKQEGAVRDLRSKLAQTIDAELRLNDRHIKSWRFAVTPDHAPAITFIKKPQASPRGSLRLSYRVADDYGVVEATAHISKTVEPPPPRAIRTTSCRLPHRLLLTTL
jgi:uncharacterized protein (TIGR02302 family)